MMNIAKPLFLTAFCAAILVSCTSHQATLTVAYPANFRAEPGTQYAVDTTTRLEGEHAGIWLQPLHTYPDLGLAVEDAIRKGSGNTVGLANAEVSIEHRYRILWANVVYTVVGNPIIRK